LACTIWAVASRLLFDASYSSGMVGDVPPLEAALTSDFA
jgi:hypothetical protein